LLLNPASRCPLLGPPRLTRPERPRIGLGMVCLELQQFRPGPAPCLWVSARISGRISRAPGEARGKSAAPAQGFILIKKQKTNKNKKRKEKRQNLRCCSLGSATTLYPKASGSARLMRPLMRALGLAARPRVFILTFARLALAVALSHRHALSLCVVTFHLLLGLAAP
jgi:hypothetical protein